MFSVLVFAGSSIRVCANVCSLGMVLTEKILRSTYYSIIIIIIIIMYGDDLTWFHIVTMIARQLFSILMVMNCHRCEMSWFCVAMAINCHCSVVSCYELSRFLFVMITHCQGSEMLQRLNCHGNDLKLLWAVVVLKYGGTELSLERIKDCLRNERSRTDFHRLHELSCHGAEIWRYWAVS